ncbi:DHH family phosphoesterase [Candidatus Saccharibacteria bacterium]|nr:DHH family phosphoesterase [Candidatus Saccharibacteria bacterium]MBH1972711.1 DHH family phosphoesterase [Candidatus Saccharibacteria bacterium]MBH1990913.1 DHH family phosphoesterase [Candidatus Saccharibacteria bacterium]
MYESATTLINDAKKIIIIQAENPDGDSLGSALALEEILGDLGKDVILYCPVEIPKYLRYILGWDRVVTDFDTSADLAIIVDTSADVLITKVLETPGVRHFLESHPVLVIDHHATKSNLTFDHTLLIDDAVATSEIIYRLASDNKWAINTHAAECMLIAIMSDSLGLTTQNVSPNAFFTAGKLTELGASNAAIEERRREFMKKSPEILAYKGELISRIEYLLDGKLAIVHIPWEDIQKYSDQYNPSVLVLDEMRLVEGVQLGVAIKTYPDGKITGKLRGNLPIAETVAGFFGGGGHKYASGFRAYENYDTIVRELVEATDKAISNYDTTAA